MSEISEKSRHVGGKPATRDEAQNRKTVDKTSDVQNKGKSIKPKNADVGDLKVDR